MGRLPFWAKGLILRLVNARGLSVRKAELAGFVAAFQAHHGVGKIVRALLADVAVPNSICRWVGHSGEVGWKVETKAVLMVDVWKS